MPLIITATDFSEVAENAVDYSCKLASLQNAHVIVIHSFVIPVMFSDMPLPGSIMAEAQKDAEQQMERLIDNMRRTYPGLQIEGKVIYGDTVDVLGDYGGNSTIPWLVVIGNAGPESKDSWPDSMLMSLLKKLEYPVLAVPAQASFQPVRKMCFAFDNKHSGTGIAIAAIMDIALQLKAELHVLIVRPNNTNASADNTVDDEVKAALSTLNPVYHLVYDTEDVDASIRNFTEKNNIDWLVMIPRKHSFFEGLFHKSHVKAIAHSSAVPILALHESKG